MKEFESAPERIPVGSIEKSKILSMYDELTKNGKMSEDKAASVLSSLVGFHLDFTPGIISRVKSFEDAIGILSPESPEVKDYKAMTSVGEQSVSPQILSFLKLRIICTALNEKWKAFPEPVTRFYPWFTIYSKSDWTKLSDEQKAEGGALIHENATEQFFGICYSYTDAVAPTFLGNCLSFRKEQLAKYCAQQFADLWGVFLTGCNCIRYRKR